MTVTVWYDKADSDPHRPWLVKRGDVVCRAAVVAFYGHACTAFRAAGFTGLQPGGPRGIIFAEQITTLDEVPVGP